mmetsp:Transcript_32065/g.42285  ORF Transcript_32065/g.42285 Transcript_32065/m.42285 type:complete len:606 (-) Transcript_32065:229-2046(-)|eukprot:CAMPEP_0117772370 /NCGR_PEP_ID=MMETSP0947-20121206/25049_1 /TAXON_ID=44440 /ORGANISM="Chattonella subsalsa, Strain CCMP2191" /LENGTH=605 /DNA_ID=CAMNT_0005597967 /DNA_START=46 /DNA_END=1863 /DNA_ORIENTATION=+
MGNTLPPPPKLTEAEERSVLDYDVTVQAIVDYILSGKAEKIVMMVGAGISVSAGIPDFRSPGTGLYNNLQKYNLPSPQSMFEIEYFRRNPKPFCELAREMYPGNFRPTPTHWFIRLLQEKGLLMRCYTQNIDTLEREAGIHDELLVEAHGSFGTARCIECGASYTQEWVREQIFADRIPRCTQVGCVVPNEKEEEEASSPHPHPRSPHAGGTSSPRPVSPKSPQPPVSGLVKPNIVFFGESLPKRFFSLKERDLPNADLIIVAGTSLAVHPFAGVKDEAGPLVPRLLINREPVGQRDSPNGHGFRFDCYDNYRDVAFLADCDRAVTVLCHLLGWKEEFEALVREYGKGITLPDLLGPIAEGEDAEEKLRQDIVHPWRRPPPPHPDLEEIREKKISPPGAVPMDISGAAGPDESWCELDFPNKLDEICGFMKIRLKISLESKLMGDVSDKDWVALMPVGSRLPTEYEDFGWPDYDDDESEEEAIRNSELQTNDLHMNGMSKYAAGSLNNTCEVQLRIPSCTSTGLPVSYEIWYIAKNDAVIARWGPFHVTKDMVIEQPPAPRDQLDDIASLLRSVQSTLDATNDAQERFQQMIANLNPDSSNQAEI